jgi:hypothetical protein
MGSAAEAGRVQAAERKLNVEYEARVMQEHERAALCAKVCACVDEQDAGASGAGEVQARFGADKRRRAARWRRIQRSQKAPGAAREKEKHQAQSNSELEAAEGWDGVSAAAARSD